MPLENALLQIAYVILTFAGAAGILALVAPDRFKRFADVMNCWVDAEKSLAVMNKRFDVDNYVLRYTRIFGALVTSACLFSAIRWFWS